MKRWATTTLELAGLGALLIGLGMVSIPLALIIGGCICVGIAVVIEIGPSR